ncbi:PTS fructose transporter subunit IIA [Methylacidiphilum kamchatkense Kam1]|uniref:Mannitol/fructose-specific phosphotransferase system IIA component (Ntr-type) n=1 Tax=Methylacidiphilum kamchatkense Kam1 TaxID=1202785 RepID=A0A0C1RT36_9BACT|nr:PTS sugar transporter subunit IIA [Methylacidiphilum kamchatkense]KIE58131.1 PTS fructose transporter subunit IIA [Methylacidiphilum kamchatkense Kam1]QDQ41538.1 mannitol/fructose-specific phosphotransferase system IIA component (Ntr-type) [Methylacidiphilum kamchatkense Kam1]
MNLSDVLTQDRVLVNLSAKDKFEAITKVAKILEHSPLLQSFDAFLEAVLEAEKSGLTWFEQEVAFPHIRSQVVKELVIAAGFFPSGVLFREAAPLVRLIFVIGAPKKLNTNDIIVVGALARIVATNRQQLLKAKSAEEFVSLIASLEKQLQ